MLKWLSSPKFCLPFKEVEIRDAEGTTQVPVPLREPAYLNASYTNSYLIVRIFFKAPSSDYTFILLGGWYPSKCLFCYVILSVLIPGVPEPSKLTMKAAAVLSRANDFLTAPCIGASGFLSVLCKQGSVPVVRKGNSSSLNLLLETKTIEYPNYFGNSSQWKTTIKCTKQITLGAEKFWEIRAWSLSNDRASESAIHV